MITVAIIEDDEKNAKQLRDIIKELQTDTVFLLYTKGEEVRQYLEVGGEIDIFFLNRKLPDINGYVLASIIREQQEYLFTPIIFVTEYEMQERDIFYEYHCYTYLFKPLNKEIVKKQIGTLLQHLDINKQKPLRKVVCIKERNNDVAVPVEHILYLEKIGRDCCVHTAKRNYLIPRKSLEKQLKEINDSFVIRCHKSFAVNLANVTQISKKHRNIWNLFFKGTKELECEVSKTYYDVVLKSFHQLVQEK